MRIPRTVLVAGAIAALVQTQAAQAAACLTETELTGMAAYAMPSVLDGAMASCKPHLAANGYFATQGPALVARYAARKDAAWPAAKAAFLKIGSAKDAKMTDTVKALPDNALQPFVEAMVAQMVGSGIKPDQCQAIERASRILAPLPPENTAELVAFIVAVADKPKPGKTADIPLCPIAGSN
ncbi:hypothetical protein [Novosphingobium lentum]|uniref:hypothetical protein n=1 Tax=Novosphingobium lentum TaxID=145287 RepID=UPI000AD7F324|nr:hypothetical protein [Novosphingobium lentum]